MEELRSAIIKLCNESGLGIEPIYFIIKDIYRDIDNSFYQYTTAKRKEEEMKKMEEKQDDN